ncbi:MAG TPA: YesL family protein [Anaerolineae bacterium]|nr:YesL family protein [Anaerolineae bacterium]
MKHGFRVFWEALKEFWDELFLLMLMNVVTVLLVIPVVTFPPALAGLWGAANLVAKGRAIHWSDYFEGFRRYFWKAWGLALLNILVAVILFTNIRFYTPANVPFDISPSVSQWIQAFFVGMALLWVIVQMYPLALLFEQEDQRLRVALRNAAVLLITNPGFTIVLLLLLLIVAAISTAIPLLWFMVTVALLAVVCNRAVLHLLEPYRERARAEAEGEDETSGEGDLG